MSAPLAPPDPNARRRQAASGSNARTAVIAVADPPAARASRVFPARPSGRPDRTTRRSQATRAAGGTRRRPSPATFGRLLVLILGLAWWLGPARPGLAQDETVPYAVEFPAALPSDVLDLLRSASETESLQDRPPASLYLLRRRAAGDRDRLKEALAARGWFASDVSFEVVEDASPVRVVFAVTPGPRYALKDVSVRYPDGTDAPRPDAEALGLKIGEPSLAEEIRDGASRLLDFLAERGRPFPRAQEPRLVADHADRSVSVEYAVDPGPSAVFGETTFEGAPNVEKDFLRHKEPWRPGDPYKRSLLDEFQSRLLAANLFSLVRVEAAPRLEDGSRLPIRVELAERPAKTVSGGLFYRSDEGPGALAAWEHRNLQGAGERLELSAQASSLSKGLGAVYTKPEFLDQANSLRLSGRLARDTTEAYDSSGLVASAVIDRRLTDKLTVGAGLGLDAADIREEDDNEETTYLLFSIPAHIDWNNKNDLLNPTAGQTASLNVTPYWDLTQGDNGFVKGLFTGTTYFQLLTSPSVVWAARGAYGVIGGSTRAAIPADKRFYAGGGGSVRGYPYQTVGPLDDDDKPLGGRSLLELSNELRYRITQTIGAVAFLDGGAAYAEQFPDLDKTFLWGAGLGLRYHAPFGPLRLDVAVPLDKRPGVDDDFQIYVSIGQAY